MLLKFALDGHKIGNVASFHICESAVIIYWINFRMFYFDGY